MRIFKTKAWKCVSMVSIALSALLVAGTTVANNYSPMVNGFLGLQTSKVVDSENGNSQYYTSDYANLEEMYQNKVKHIREEAREGTVLLKNNGILPLAKGKKVGVLGANDLMFDATSGGGGFHSDEVDAKKTGLIDALKFDGLTVTEEKSEFASADAVIVVLGRHWGEGSDMPVGNLILTQDEVERINTAKAANKNMIFLVSGEYSIEIGAYVKDCAAIVKAGNMGFRGAYGLADVLTGVVSPSGKLVDTWAASSYSSPAMENWGDFEYANKNKIMASQANKYVSYNEGIYTDYRYYETRYEDCVLSQGNANGSAGVQKSSGGWSYSSEVLYSFGFGLSYTTFEKKIEDVSFHPEQRTATVTVNVKNTGNVDGKEVVEVYAQTPYTQYDKQNKVEKSSVQLVGFEKTSTLKANGGEETVKVEIPMQWLASFDYTGAKTYIMDAGDYYFSIGNGAHDALNNILEVKGKTVANGMTAKGNASLVYSWKQNALDTTTYSTSVYTGAKIDNRFDDADLNYWINGKVTYLTRSDWQGTYPVTVKLSASDDMIASLNDTKKYENGKWNDLKDRVKEQEVECLELYDDASVNSYLAANAAENVVAMRGKDYDDPAWETILNRLSIYEMSRLVAEGRYFINACPSVTFAQGTGGDGPVGILKNYRYYSIDQTTGEAVELKKDQTMQDGITNDVVTATLLDAGMYTSECVLAATWNKDLAFERGKFIGEDGLYTGTSYLWGLGTNLHRTPYTGRMAEYFSADGVLNSMIGAPVTRGSKEKGVVLVVKHFAGNEQDQNRIGVATFTNEQAFRENYLRAFEGIATYGEMQGIMTAYNRIGILSCTAEYDLITGVLREEWGSTAYTMSDLNSPTSGLYDGNAAIVAGLSNFLNNGNFNATSGSYANCTLNPKNIGADPLLLAAAREASHRILYNFIHSNQVNGISETSHVEFITPWWQPTLITLDVLCVLVAVASSALYVISANRKEEN